MACSVPWFEMCGQLFDLLSTCLLLCRKGRPLTLLGLLVRAFNFCSNQPRIGPRPSTTESAQPAMVSCRKPPVLLSMHKSDVLCGLSQSTVTRYLSPGKWCGGAVMARLYTVPFPMVLYRVRFMCRMAPTRELNLGHGSWRALLASRSYTVVCLYRAVSGHASPLEACSREHSTSGVVRNMQPLRHRRSFRDRTVSTAQGYLPLEHKHSSRSTQPRPTPHHPPQRLISQYLESRRTKIQIRRLTPHTPIHNHHINAPIPAPVPLVPLHSYLLPAQRVSVRVAAPIARGIEDGVRHGHDGVGSRGGPPACAEAGGVVG